MIPDDPDDLLECDEEDQLGQGFTNDSTIFFEGKVTLGPPPPPPTTEIPPPSQRLPPSFAT